jgi:hypothetical protein
MREYLKAKAEKDALAEAVKLAASQPPTVVAEPPPAPTPNPTPVAAPPVQISLPPPVQEVKPQVPAPASARLRPRSAGRVLESAAGGLKLPQMRLSSVRPVLRSEHLTGPDLNDDVPKPTGPLAPVVPKQRARIPVAIEVADVATFSKAATRQEVAEIRLVTSEYSTELEEFYGNGKGIPFVPAVIPTQTRAKPMSHPLQSRKAQPHPHVKRLGVPETW